LSVKLYTSTASEGIQKKIAENLEFIKNNPYPKDELQSALDSAGQDSALSKLYTLDGQTEGFIFRTPEANLAAKQEADIYPGLWAKLMNGQKSLTRLDRNKQLEQVNPENEITAGFNKFISELNKSISAGAKINVSDIFSDKTTDDEFDDMVSTLDISLNSYGADSLIRPAFTELFNASKQSQIPVETAKSSINAAPIPTESKEGASSINAVTAGPTALASGASAPINPTATKSVEPTSVTNLEGSVTSKAGELQTENILETNPSQAININLESKPVGAVASTSTTVNEVNSNSSSTINPTNTSSSVGATSDKNIMKVENTNNQSSSSTVNENKVEKEKGGFLTKIGNFAKKAGAALNLPSVADLGEQAKGLFGAVGSNISSRVSEVTNSFALNSNKSEVNSSPKTSSSNSVNSSNTTTNTKPDILAAPNTSTTSATENLLKTETQNSMNVEQKLPSVTAAISPAPVTNTQVAPVASTDVSNTINSQTSSSPQITNTNTAQNVQAQGQPANTPPGMGVNVDNSQLAQSIQRLERILISGIEVTIKDA
jgi:hypothetical protein